MIIMIQNHMIKMYYVLSNEHENYMINNCLLFIRDVVVPCDRVFETTYDNITISNKVIHSYVR